MPTPFDQLLKDLQAAQGDTAALALVTFDFAVGKDPMLKEAAIAAAIPHWFDASSLAALIPEHADRADCLIEQLKALPMVERYERGTGEPVWNVHEATRLALRERLWQTAPERFKELSRLAAAAYGRADAAALDFALTCEHLYHQLASQTNAGDAFMAWVAGNWRASFRTEPLQTLARLLEELLAIKPAPPLLPRGQGLANLAIADARANYQPAPITAESLAKAEVIFRSLSASDPANSEWQRDLSVSLENLGELAVVQGDTAAALRYFSESKSIAERLVESDPSNAASQRDLSISLNKLGDLALARGDLAAALRYLKQDLVIAEYLAASEPTNTELQRDVSVSLNKLGDIAVARGDLDAALRSFTEAKIIAERLIASDPANLAWQRDLIVSVERLGNVAMEQGDVSTSIMYFERSQQGWSKLIEQDPADISLQRGITFPLNRLGDLAVEQRDLDAALRYYNEAKTIAERLAVSDPANAEWQRDLTVSLTKIGDLAMVQGNLDAALRSFTQAKTIRERLAASDPANADWQRDLWVSYWKLADNCEKSGDAKEAKVWWKKAYDILVGMKERGLHLSPKDLGFVERLRAKAEK